MNRLRNTARAKSIAFCFLLAIACSAAAASPAQAGTVRGQLYRVVYGRSYPASYVAVTLFNGRVGRSSPAYSDAQGMYYLLNAPPGQYVLEVWWSRDPRVAPMTFNIVVNNTPFTDIAPIRVP